MNHKIDKDKKELKLIFSGDLLSNNIEDLWEDINPVINSDEVKKAEVDTWILDMNNTQMVDSLGLNLIVSLIKKAQKAGAKVKAIVLSHVVYMTLLNTRVHEKMEIAYLGKE